MGDLGVGHHRHHGKEAGEGDEAESVQHGAAAGHMAGQAQPQGGHQGNGDGGGGDASRIVGQGNDEARREEGLSHRHHVSADDEPVDGIAADDAPGAQHQPDGDAQGHRGAQSPDADGAAGDLVGLDGHRQQGRLGDGGGEAHGEGEQIDPVVVGPVEVPRRGSGRQSDEKSGIGELCGHRLAQGEEGQIQPLQKKGQAHQHIEETQQHPLEVGNGASQHQKLEAEDHQSDGQDVEEGGGGGVQQAVQQLHVTTIP